MDRRNLTLRSRFILANLLKGSPLFLTFALNPGVELSFLVGHVGRYHCLLSNALVKTDTDDCETLRSESLEVRSTLEAVESESVTRLSRRFSKRKQRAPTAFSKCQYAGVLIFSIFWIA